MMDIRMPRIDVDRLLLYAFTGASCLTSGFVGYMTPEFMWARILWAFLFGYIAYALARNIDMTARAFVNGARWWALIVMCMYCIFLSAANVFTDFIAASYVRTSGSTVVQNTNIAARQNREQVQEYERTLKSLDGDLANPKFSGINTPEFYDAELLKLKAVLSSNGRNIWSRSKDCTSVTLPESRDHCAKIAAAQAHLGLANEKRRLQDRRLQIMSALPEARRLSQATVQKTDATVAILDPLISLATSSLHHGDGTLNWGRLFISLGCAALFTLIISLESVKNAIASERSKRKRRLITDDRKDKTKNELIEERRVAFKQWQRDTPDKVRRKYYDHDRYRMDLRRILDEFDAREKSRADGAI